MLVGLTGLVFFGDDLGPRGLLLVMFLFKTVLDGVCLDFMLLLQLMVSLLL